MSYAQNQDSANAHAPATMTKESRTEVSDRLELRPPNMETLMKTVQKSPRTLMVEEGWLSGRLTEQALYQLDARLTAMQQEGDPKPGDPEIPPEPEQPQTPESPEIPAEPAPTPETEPPLDPSPPPEIEPPVGGKAYFGTRSHQHAHAPPGNQTA